MQEDDLFGKIKDVVSQVLQDENVELVDITYKRESGLKVLRILADTEKGITVDECAKLDGVINEALDRSGLMDESYVLEVSSPGLDRPLGRKRDFMRVAGKRIRVNTFAPIDGRKEFSGRLDKIDDEGISILDDNAKVVEIPFDKISKAVLDYESLF